MRHKHIFKSILMSFSLLAIAACGSDGIQTEAKYPSGLDRNQTGGDDNIYGDKESIFGVDGLSIFGGRKKEGEGTGSGGIGVNSFLWRASLDTISFMPLASADPFGGVILTDWYTPPETKDERFKINVFILGRELRSDGVRVRAFKQIRKKGTWVDAQIANGTARDLEDTILTRARQLRIAQISE